MKRVVVLGIVLLAAPALCPQIQTQSAAPPSANALLSNNDALALVRHISQLVESTMLATPASRGRARRLPRTFARRW